MTTSGSRPAPDPFFDDQSEENFRDLEEWVARGGVTGFIGAGLSQTAGMPGWAELWRRLCEAARTPGDPHCQEFVPDAGPSELLAFRDELGEAAYLQLMRELFDKPVMTAPEAYRMVAETAFKVLATTNYDNFLYGVALRRDRAPVFQTYPEERRDAKYIYLHGRAGHAKGINDLVLCEDDYDLAYGQANGSAYRTVVTLLQSGPCVFIGSSLSDRDLQRVLRSTKDARRRLGKLGGRHQETYDGDPPWFAILAADLGGHIKVRRDRALEGAPDERNLEQEALQSKVGEDSRRFRAWGIKPIWYVHDASHSRLLALLRRLREARGPESREAEEPVFLMRASELEELGSLEQPGPEQQARVIDLLRTVPECRRHFFAHAKSLAWFEILRETGVLTEIIEKPRRDSAGNVQISLWEAAPYVEFVAKKKPDWVARLVSEIQSENWHVLTVLSTVVQDFPTGLVLPLIPRIADWLETPYIGASLVGHNVIQLLQRLTGEEESRGAIALLEALLRPIKRGDARVETRASEYEAARALSISAELSEKVPDLTVPLFQRLLLEALDLDLGSQKPRWSGWRPAIEDSRQNRPADSALDLLLVGLRNANLGLARRDIKGGTRTIRAFLTSGEPILRRVALHVVSEEPRLLDNVGDVLLPGSTLFDVDSFHEQMVLLSRHFTLLSRDEQTRIHRMIEEGPPPRPTEAEERGEKSEERRDSWRWHILSVLPEVALTPEEQGWLSDLSQRRGSPEEPFFLVYSTGVFSPRAPASADDLRTIKAEGLDKLAAVLRNPESRFEISWSMETELVWGSVRPLISEDPDGLLGLAELLTIEDIPHAWQYFDAYAELARSGVTFRWDRLVGFCERIVADQAIGVPGNTTWAWSICRLLREGLTATARIPDDLLDRTLPVLETIAEGFSTRLEAESGDGERRDLMFRQLNEPGGIAADAILLLMWRCLEMVSQPENEARVLVGRNLAEKAKVVVERTIATGWGGMEMRHALGHYLVVVERLWPGWTVCNAEQVSSPSADPQAVNAARAFWSGYLSSQNVYDDLLRTLRPQYAQVLPDLAQTMPRYLESRELQKRLAEHVVIGRVRGVEGFGLDALLGDLTSHGSDELLGDIVWFLGAELSAAVDRSDDEWFGTLWAAMDEYWQHRLEALRQKLDPDAVSKEASSYAFWLRSVRLGPAELEEKIGFTIQHAELGHHLEDVASYLMSHAAQEPGPTSRLARALISRWARGREIVWMARNLEQLLRETWRAGGKDERRLVTECIDELLRERGIDFRDILTS